MAQAKKASKKTKAEEKQQLTEVVESETAATDKETEEAIQEAQVTEADTEEKATAKAGKRSAKAQREETEKEEKQARKTKSDESEGKPKVTKKPTRPKVERAGKKYREAAKLIDKSKVYKLEEALDLARKSSPTKFDATVELHVNLGVDPKQADQNVRDTVTLPAGTGKTLKIAVFAEGDDIKAAKNAGAEVAGTDEITAMLEKEQLDFDVLISTPTLMARLGKYARLLGPRGLMPNPKSGTVTTDIAKAVTEAKAGRVEYRVDQAGIIHLGIGKASFDNDKLLSNADAVLSSIRAAKPASLKGIYIKNIYITTSMGPSVKVEV
jgi:large subunit ribosomal protein L1